MKHDFTYLGQDAVFLTDCEETELNNNEIIIGGTGTGKTTSFIEPKLLHAKCSSYIIPISKRKLAKQYIPYMKKNGYRVFDLNFANAYESSIGFDLFDYLSTEDDFRWLAEQITEGITEESLWCISACAVLVAEMMFLKLTKEEFGIHDLLLFHQSIKLDASGPLLTTSVDMEFAKLQVAFPENMALKEWHVLHGNTAKTAACIFSTVSICLHEFMKEDIITLADCNDRFDIKELGFIRTALFITTSPVDLSIQKYINLVYTVIFKELFEAAERETDEKLPVPVRIVCDDFACGAKIPEFERYISIFRSTGISVTLLVQSESQLASMYGDNSENIIMNNCDTFVYTGGLDTKSCYLFSALTNRPYEDILFLKRGDVVIVRRGEPPIFTRRYQTYMDPLYQNIC